MNKLDLIFDGAMHTYYVKKTNSITTSELANEKDSKIIIDIHKEYIKAGATAIKTNTFGLNSLLVEDKELKKNLIIKAIDNAREAIKDSNVMIFANIGPITSDNREEEYLEIVKIFIDEKINKFIFETQLEYNVLKKSIAYIRKNVEDSIVITSFASNQDGYTSLGNYYLNLLNFAKDDCDYVGLNCICGPSHIYELVKKINYSEYKLCIMPNAGYPSCDNIVRFEENVDYFAAKMVEFLNFKVKIIGGCCGTSPNHIKRIVELVAKYHSKKEKVISLKHHKQKVKSIVASIFNSKRKLIAVEVEPPKTTDITNLLDTSLLLKDLQVDLITLVDSPLANARADSLMIASKIKRELDIEVLPHLCCRDKNQIAIKGGLIGANIDNINNVLAISGDAIAKIDRDFNKGVFCFNSMNLISYINQLNEDIFNDNPFYIAAALNINAVNFKGELKRAQDKIDNKVDYFITQSIFTKKAIDNLKEARRVLKVPIVVGLYPIVSYRNALFLNNEVKGITIDEDLIDKFSKAKQEDYQKISTDFIKDVIDQVNDYCDGYYLSIPLRKTEYVIDLIKYIKNKDRGDA